MQKYNNHKYKTKIMFIFIVVFIKLREIRNHYRGFDIKNVGANDYSPLFKFISLIYCRDVARNVSTDYRLSNNNVYRNIFYPYAVHTSAWNRYFGTFVVGRNICNGAAVDVVNHNVATDERRSLYNDSVTECID